MPADLRQAIADALAAFATQPLPAAARTLLRTLGYASGRTLPITTPRQFRDQLDPANKLTDRDREALDRCTALHLLFQFTGAELQAQGADLFEDANAVQTTRIESYLFFAAELPPGHYTRTDLATLVRAVNKPLPMPALVLFKHGDTVSLGIIHRRLSKRDAAKDVLEKVTLIKDIAFADPIRAHVEILHDFALPQLVADYAVANFVALHEAWQKRLGSYALSNEFYREIADWYFWAHHQVEDGAIRLPLHCDTEQEKSLFLIRLLTRVIFCWFLVEKRLIPTDLFREHRLRALLKDFAPARDPARPDTAPAYYHAILQNLFFGTLNMPPENRGFRKRNQSGGRDPNYGVTNLWRYEDYFHKPADWEKLAARVPFLNGGLFDCLDDKTGKKQDNTILDGFSDNPKLACHLPNDLFFGPERTVDLSHDYGEEDKRTARSKHARVRGLIHILSRYKFTIEENTPLEEEIALDPELLGKVFENLLASYNEDTRTTARKALGAFYTPREIVSYMVDEALKSYLATQVPRCKGALDDLFSNKATLRDIRPDTRDALIAAIGRVRILDPACGSGAFPMGALHRLVDLLQKLDPNNESWKRDRLAEARRYRQLLASANATPDELAACDARIADIEKSFDTRYHALDFARKLYLIENAIYGVDIQPIATQIAKLRFFIALVVDQKVDPSAPNLGVRPLPNLETRLVAADTLIPIDKPNGHQFDLLDPGIRPLRRQLEEVRHEHFNARSPASKRKCRERDAELRTAIAHLLQGAQLPDREKRVVSTFMEELDGLFRRCRAKDTDSLGLAAEASKNLQQAKQQLGVMLASGHQQPRAQQELEKMLALVTAAIPVVGKAKQQITLFTALNDLLAALKPKAQQLLHGTGLSADAARQLAAWDPYDQNTSAPFFDPEWMFGLTKTDAALPAEARKGEGWFDIVIGNPPYVRQEQLKHLKEAFKQHYECFTGTADLYVYFYEAGIKFLRDGGTFSFITSNKWFRAGYGAKLRGWLAEKTRVLQLIDFGDAPVFTAIAYPCIVITQRTATPVEAGVSVRALTWEPGPPIETFADVFARKSFTLPQRELKPDGWRLESGTTLRLLERLRAAGKPLGEYVNGRFYYGIKTGLNEAFVVDRATRDRLIAEHQSSAEVLKPFLRGRDVKRWRVDSQDLWLVFVPWHFPLHQDPCVTGASAKAEAEFKRHYPAIYKHLLQFKDALAARNTAETGKRYEWYALQRWGAEYWQEFEQPKVLYPDIYEHQSFTWDAAGHFAANTCYFIPTTEKWFTGLLNSLAVEWFYGNISNRVRGGYLRAFSDYMKEIPIPPATDAQQATIERLVDVLLWLHRHLAEHPGEAGTRDALMVAYWERVLNGLVYELYFPDELHAAGLRLFDSVGQAFLPATPEPSADRNVCATFLPTLRAKFEELADAAHPLRRALDHLATLETVRIIEGKA
jgi:hypothetical protein